MFDIFYSGKKPGLFAHEREADSIEHAQQLSRTRFFWWVTYLADLSGWDFLWEPVPWQAHQRHAWPSQHQADSGVYLVPTTWTGETNYRTDRTITRLPGGAWRTPSNITADFDYSWHPDYREPVYEYHFGTQHQSAGGPVYNSGAGNIKLLSQPRAVARVEYAYWSCPDHIDFDSVDYTWHPNSLDPPYIYHFPSQWQRASGVTYTVTGATEIRMCDDFTVRAVATDVWMIPDTVAEFDRSWHPDALDPPYTYEFGTQWWDEGGPVYTVAGSTELKYIDQPRAQVMPSRNNWEICHDIHQDRFDWSWCPHPKDPPYTYVWGNQHWPAEKMPTVIYHVAGATERKYMDTQATLRPVTTNWHTPDMIDPTSVDYSWVPDPQDPPYIYEFATQWQPNGGAVYTVPGATERKYVEHQHLRLPDKSAFNKLEVIQGFDYSWHPSNTEEPYVYVFGNQHWPATIMPTVTYTVPGATKEKFVQGVIAKLASNMGNWEFYEDLDQIAWDWTWVPNPKDPPYVYVFGNQWNPPEYKASIKYVTPGATEVKYMESRAVRLPCPELFAHNIAVSKFDYSWEPNPFDPPYVYVFGNQWNPAVLEPTVVYTVPGATEIKYVDDVIANVAQSPADFELLDNIESFDYSWRPNPTDPEYIYVFGNQWLTPEQRPALQYRVGSATTIKYMSEPRALRVGSPHLFTTHYDCDFDYSWEPDPGSPPYTYVFGNQWYNAERMPTVEYHVAGATERKYMTEPVAKLHERHSNHWHTLEDCEWDYSWQPDPGDPPLIYVWGNQHWPAVQMPTVEYHVEGATERKYMEEPVAKLLPNESSWCVPEEVDRTNIDFSWVPDPGNDPYIYHFGTEYQSSVGLTYTVPGAVNIKFEGDIPRLQKEKKAVQVQDIFYMDRSNALSSARFKQLQERYPHVQKIRYVNSIQDTIKRCLNKTKQNRFWVIGSENDYSEFDFAWHAQPWQSSMTHVFGSQWNKWSDTFLINRWEFERHAKWAKNIEEFPNLNFVTDQRIHAPSDAHDIYVVDFGNKESADVVTNLEQRYRVVKKARYFDNYLDTLKRLLDGVTDDHVWVVGSVCDYTTFDFSWQPEAWQRDMLHVFPSNEQKFGDTFFVPVKALQAKIAELELLDWFETVNYCEDQRVPRWPVPVVQHTSDSHVNVVREHTWTAPLTVFTAVDYANNKLPTISLWRDRNKTIVPMSTGASTVIVPQVAVPYIRTQLYDYPYIDKTQRTQKDHPLDIVFISNGEPYAEFNYQHLVWAVQMEGLDCNHIHHSKGVNGRVAAYQAAARLSTTPWFFAVFAKLEVDHRFDWTWQPDRMQQPKHYIFHAHNPVNGLVYGHQAMIAYNRQMTLENTGGGLDFTMDQPHEVVPIISGTANYTESPWMAWRTAFREVLKLKHSLPDVENEYRLNMWLSDAGEVKNAEWSRFGAEDAVEYYNEVNGDFAALKKSYEWEWLASYAFMRRSLQPDR